MWNPRKEKANILNRAMDHIRSVAYKVSIRWVFYRLLQEGIYSTKQDYKRLIYLSSKARKAFWNGWFPDTLADETRSPILQGNGA